MSLIINHNLMAMNAARNLGTAFGHLSVSVRRLSSGLRIGSASDDAAGMAIRELMRSDIASLHQGIRNANDAISLIQTADGALSIIDEKLVRMTELAEQAATGTYNSDQRLIIDSEYQAMASEITRIANFTDFNGLYLLNGNLSGPTHDGSGLQSTGKMKIHFGSLNDSAEDYYYLQVGNATASALGVGGRVSTTTITTYTGLTESQYIANNSLNVGSQNTDTLANVFATIVGDPAAVAAQFNTTQTVNEYLDAGNTTWYVFATDTSDRLHVLRYDNGFPNYRGDGVIGVSTTAIITTSNGASVSTQQLAQQALQILKSAIVSKDTIRAQLGAMQNRLSNTISNLQIQAENLQAAESRISDVDVSLEMTEFVRQQILSQAAVAMLAQANSLPRLAMQLLGG